MIMVIRDERGQVRGMIDLPERREGNGATRQAVEIRAGLRGAGWTMAPPEDRTADLLAGAGEVKGPPGMGPWPHEVVRYGGGA